MTDIPTYETELLPCPFCENAVIECRVFDDGWKFAGVCTKCKTRGPVYRTRPEAQLAWNARPARDAEVDRLKAEVEHLENTAPLRREKLNQLVHYRNEVKALREALEHYADPSNWNWLNASRSKAETVRQRYLVSDKNGYDLAKAALNQTEDKDAN